MTSRHSSSPRSSATFLARSSATAFAAATNLTCLAVATFSTAPSTRPCRVSDVSLHLQRTGGVPQRLPERLRELRVDVALPILAEVDLRNRRTAPRLQSKSGGRRTHCRRCSRPSPLLTVPPLLTEAM